MIEKRISLVEDILGAYTNDLGDDYLGYKNHVYRMIHFCFSLHDFTYEERKKIIIAGCFHDLGIWTDDTFDYLPPSIALAREYLTQNGFDKWASDIELMIDLHHRLRKWPDPLVEMFRKGDLVDFSLGIVKCGVPADFVNEVKASFPNAGFHKKLVRLAGSWFCRHPLNPIPVLKW